MRDNAYNAADRVFGHALNTVNKIRPGSQKPPAQDRLSLYGLYEQCLVPDTAVLIYAGSLGRFSHRISSRPPR